jgi:hypothetical protein
VAELSVSGKSVKAKLVELDLSAGA